MRESGENLTLWPMGAAKKWQSCAQLLALLTMASFSMWAQGVTNVITRSYSTQRTGANLSETVLTASNVNSSQFGKLFMVPVDDQIYAQILYVSSLSIAGGVHNVIYVATANNTIYAFDADTLGSPLWQKNFNGVGVPSVNTELGQACTNGYHDFLGNIGIVSTPAIDLSSLTMYFLTRTVESGVTVQRLRAIDIRTGAEEAYSPQVIQASIAGTGDGGSTVTFNPVTQNQRSALSISQGIVYLAWASFCDTRPYHGWVMAYDETTLAQVGVFNTSPSGGQAGIWMAGAGLAFDTSGNVYFGTGNGTTDDVTDFGESLLKLSASSLVRLDYFTASNFATLNSTDGDFGASGPSMLPGTTLLTSGAKEGKLYLINTSSLGHEVSGDTQIPQVFQAVNTTIRPTATHHIHNISPSWNSPEGLNVYVWGENDYLHGFRFNASTQTFNSSPFATGAILPPQGMPGGMMTISADVSQAGTGVLWATVPRNGDANRTITPGNLYAFNAETLSLLWSSTGIGDDTYSFSKGSIPVIANGKVYVGSGSALVDVYGLRSIVPPSQNLALNKVATGSTPCSSSEGPAKAFNGSYSQGLSDKFCSKVANAYLEVDLGTPMTVSRFIVEHAGAGGESLNLNSAAFNIDISTDGVTFTTMVNVTGNTLSITTHDITPATARYVRMTVTKPTQTSDTTTRIYEFQVFNAFSSGNIAPPDFSLSLTPASQAVTAGAEATYTAMTSAMNGFNGDVTFSASGQPSGATVTFNPTSVTGSGGSQVTVSTSSSTPAGTYTLAITGTSGTLQHTATVSFSVNNASPDFSLSLTPASQSVTAGAQATYTATTLALNGFNSSVTFSASGQPSGATVTFNPTSVTGSGGSQVTVSTSSSTPAGTYTLAITGTSGALQHTATVSFTVNSMNGSVSVSLSSAYNRIGIVTDGSTFTGGIDTKGFAYSAELLGSTQTFNGSTFDIGPPNVMNVVSSATVALPAGQFSSVNLLATAVNGHQTSQTFAVTYTDGTTSTFTQSLSDWFTPGGYSGETTLLAMAYRDVYNGTKDNRTFHAYAYTFVLNQAKIVSSITLPSNTKVVVLAMTLVQ